MDLPVSQDEYYHVLVYLLLQLVALLNCGRQQHVEVGGAAELQVLDGVAVCFHDALDHENMGVRLVAVEGEAVMGFALGVKGWHLAFGTESVNWHLLVIVVVEKDLGYLLKGFFVWAFFICSNIVEGSW